MKTEFLTQPFTHILAPRQYITKCEYGEAFYNANTRHTTPKCSCTKVTIIVAGILLASMVYFSTL